MSYIDSLKEEASKKKFSFSGFIKQLSDGNDLYGFVEDVLSENTRQMSCAFPPSKNNGTDIIVFDEMAKLPDTVQIGDILKKIFEKALKGKFLNSLTVISQSLTTPIHLAIR